ncbi:MAG: hypothetical protein IJK52_11630 [Oscillospiraceae bacterium]|nr:hypothetical protein [Oscillospiraceae bacterium]
MSRYFTKDWFYGIFRNEDCVIRRSFRGISASAEVDSDPEERKILNSDAGRLKIRMNIDAPSFLSDVTLRDAAGECRFVFDSEAQEAARSALSQAIRERYHTGLVSWWHRNLDRDVPGYRPLTDGESELIRAALSGAAYRPWAFRSPCEAMGALDSLSEKIASDLDAADTYDPDALDWMSCLSELRRKILTRGLPAITEPDMFYGVEVSHAGIAVKLFHIQISYEISDADGSAESGLRRPVLVKRRSTALFSGMPLLSCAEYARRRGVSESDVHDWIRRGELRSAVEGNGEWRVPADTKAPDGRFETQAWSLTKRPIPETAARDYPFLASLSPGQLFQISEDESGAYVVAPLEKGKSGSAGQSVAVLSREERERFEFCLLRSDWAIYDDEKYMIPVRDSPPLTED